MSGFNTVAESIRQVTRTASSWQPDDGQTYWALDEALCGLFDHIKDNPNEVFNISPVIMGCRYKLRDCEAALPRARLSYFLAKCHMLRREPDFQVIDHHLRDAEGMLEAVIKDLEELGLRAVVVDGIRCMQGEAYEASIQAKELEARAN